jgi:imidazoleglycerol-phosphate dehydratase
MARLDQAGRVVRRTKETDIEVDFLVNGTGKADLKTGVPFLDHMLTLFAVHGFFDLRIAASGDLEVDAHHTVEDIGICMGQALAGALSDRSGIRRYGQSAVPMDETCASVILDLSNRPYLVYRVPGMAERVGEFDTELVPEFFRAFCTHGGVTLHIDVPYGSNTHHIIEAIFKAWGRALDEATRRDERRAGVPSSKGAL